MKFSDRQNVALEAKKIETAWKNNSPLLEESFQRYAVPVPEEIAEMLKSKAVRLDKVIPVSFEEFTKRWPEESAITTAPAMKIAEAATKSHFPVLYLYAPELQEKVLEAAEKRRRAANCNRLCELLKKICGEDASVDFKNFVTEVLPVELPKQVYFDGSSTRVQKLGDLPGARWFPYIGVMAAIYSKDGEDVLTIYVDGLDYVKSFSKHLVKKLGVTEDIAMKISSSLPHDEYYTVRGFVETDMEKHATQMARLLQVKEGDKVTDLYQGEVEVVTGVLSKKLALDLDDELPSAILVGTKVNVYLPASSK